jgi:cytochrome c peroxidase
VNTLEEVLDHYAAGGRAGGHPNRSPLLRGFTLTLREKADLVAFLKALTDRDFVTNPKFRDPWEE